MINENETALLERQRKEREALSQDRVTDTNTGIVGETLVGDRPGMNPAATGHAMGPNLAMNPAATPTPAVRHERYEHPERSQQPDPPRTDTQVAEDVQRRANRQPHSERTVNGGKTLP